jgi:uncharacterized protein
MIFLDTGAFVARYVERDQHHEPATEYWRKVESERIPCWTSNFVLDEAFTLLGRVCGNRFAYDRAQAIYASRILTILRPDAAVEGEALSLFVKYADQSVSFTDCTSFVLMRRQGLKRVFGFDDHFRLAGFAVLP